SDLVQNFEYVYENLASHDSEGGLSGLPTEVRHHVMDVCYFLQQIACLIILDVINEREFVALFRSRVIATWDAVGPFIKQERLIDPRLGAEFFTPLEAFATKAKKMSPEIGQRILKRWIERPL